MQAQFSDLIGKVVNKVERDDGYDGNERITFYTNDGVYVMEHDQDCCETVSLIDVAGGELSGLEGQTVLVAYENSNRGNEVELEKYESCTWTFYTIRTMLDTLTLRWFGSSNGYYGESVSFKRSE